MGTAWDFELAEFLKDLSTVQDATLEILSTKRQCIVDKDLEGLAAIGDREQDVIRRLEQCLRQRAGLLDRAAKEGLPSDSIESLTAALPAPQRRDLRTRVRQSEAPIKGGFTVQTTSSWTGPLTSLIKTGLNKHIEYAALGAEECRRLIDELKRDDIGHLVCSPRLIDTIVRDAGLFLIG